MASQEPSTSGGAGTTRPRPRPKPRPKPVSTDASTSVAAGPDVRDAFIVKRSKDPAQQELKQKRIEEAKKSAAAIEISDDEDDKKNVDDGIGHEGRRKEYKKKATTPQWKKMRQSVDLESRGRSRSRTFSDSGSRSSSVDLQELTPTAARTGKRKDRSRSRSRSLTPPPLPNAYEIYRIRQATQQFARGGRPATTTAYTGDDDDDPEDPRLSDLNPELRRALEVAKEKGRSGAAPSGPSTKVTINIKWVHFPGQPRPINIPETPFKYEHGYKEPFHSLLVKIASRVLVHATSIDLTRDERKIIPGATPESINGNGEFELTAMENRTTQYLKELASRHPPTPSSPSDPFFISGARQISREPSLAPSEGEGSSEKIKILLKSSSHQVKVLAKQSTTCGQLVAHFIKKLGLGSTGKGRIMFDGDKQDDDTPIAEFELDEGDILEVVGV